MEATPRMKQILQILLKETEAISVKNLAEKIGVSKRTVQRELEYVNQTLKGYEVRFLSKTGVGVWVEGEAKERQRLLLDISEGDSYDVTNREERRKRLILELLKEKGLKKLFYYSSQFGVSEATVSTDLEAAQTWMVQYNLHIVRKPGSGVLVEGSEENYRRAIRAFVSENMDTKIVREAYERPNGVLGYCETLKKSDIGRILNDTIVERVIHCIGEIDSARVLTLTESSYVGLIIHISIAVNRILKNEVIEQDEGWKAQLKDDEDYRLAMVITEALEGEFGIQIPKLEVSYICLHIKGAKHEKIEWDGMSSLEIGSRELQRLVSTMIDAFDQESAYLLKQDDEFIQGLLAHLQPTLIRLLHGMHIHNPVLGDIKKNYPDIYEKCRGAAEILEEEIGKKIPEEEIGFLAVHFGAAMVRLEGRSEKIRKVHAGVICASGIGLSRLMTSKLESAFKDRMQMTSYGKNDITPYIAGKMDFFITSMPLDSVDIPVILVNPLLSEEDMEHIRSMIYQYERLPEKQKGTDTFALQLEEINLMASQIKTVIKYMEFFKVDNQITFDELLIAVGEKLSPYSDRRDIIREDIMRRERIASQVFAEFGFALLHTCTKGVIRPNFSVCMTKDLGVFENAYLKGVKVIFIMLVPLDDKQKINKEIMGYISSMLIEECEFMDIAGSGQKEAIRGALSANLKKFFNRYISGMS